jgi:uncharacterized protein YqeY
MTLMTLRTRITEDVKTAMKARDTQRLSTLRLLTAAIKQREVDERIELDDAQIVAVLEKMIKQRRESVSQYQAGNRQDLADVEVLEIGILSGYLPQQLADAEIAAEVVSAIAASGAAGPADMGKVMAVLKGRLAGRADMGKVSALVKQKLSAA